jgi:hypothetical protein
LATWKAGRAALNSEEGKKLCLFRKEISMCPTLKKKGRLKKLNSEGSSYTQKRKVLATLKDVV